MAEARIGVIAGAGRFPVLFAEQARRQGLEVVALCIKGVTDPAIEALASVKYFKLGQLDEPIRFLKEAGVSRAVMAGKVAHSSLFGGVLPDLRAVKVLAGLGDRRTDTILAAVAAEFAKDGIELIPSATYLSHLLPAAGTLTRRAPDPGQKADVALGWRAAKAVAGFDIGQTVVVCQGAVVAVEAMEGTDAAIERAAAVARAHGSRPALTVVKVAKPRQDLRFDLPVVGLATLAILERCRVGCLAVEAGKTLIFDRGEFLAGADALGLAVLAVAPEEP